MEKEIISNKKGKVESKVDAGYSTKIVTVIGTGSHKALPKGTEHEVSESSANALIHAGRATLKKEK